MTFHRPVLLAAIGALALPGVAHAATFTVDPTNPAGCGGADTTCRTIAEAAAAVAAGDTVELAAARFDESATFDVPVTVRGRTGTLVVNAAGSAPTLTFSAAAAPGAALERVTVISLVQGGAPAVLSGGAGGLTVRDSVLSSLAGPGLRLTAGPSLVQRSGMFALAETADAVQLTTSTGDDRSLTLDSALLSGGPRGAGLRATSSGPSAGTTTVAARHVTVAGSADGIVADAGGALMGGDIAATVADSIVLGTSGATSRAAVLVVPGNTATLTFARSLQTGDAAALFAAPARRDFRLRPGAPGAIDVGGTTAGESATDIEGQARVFGAASDLGADELHPAPAVVRPPAVAPPAAAPAPRLAPEARITMPRRSQTLRLTSTRTRTVRRDGRARRVRRQVPRTLRFSGTSRDPQGVRDVFVVLVQEGAAAAGRCRFYDRRAGIVVRPCAQTVFLKAQVSPTGRWTYALPAGARHRPRPGHYTLYVAASDRTGAAGNAAGIQHVRFRLR